MTGMPVAGPQIFEGRDDLYKLWVGWLMLRTVAPEITTYLEDNTTSVVTILWDPTISNYGEMLNGTISINPDKHKNKFDTVATLGHESFHAIADLNGFGENSAYEEACAHSIHQAIDFAFGRWSHTFLCHVFDPWNDLRLDTPDNLVVAYVNSNVWDKHPGIIGIQQTTTYIDGAYDIKTHYVINRMPKDGGYGVMKALYLRFYPGKKK